MFVSVTIPMSASPKGVGSIQNANVPRRPVGADLSAKAPVQLMHFRRMTLSFRGRVRSHGCLFQSQFQGQPLPTDVCSTRIPMSAAPTGIGSIQKPNVSRIPVGADLSAKGPVQLMHFRRMALSFRGRVRSHGCLFQSKFQCQPLPRVLAPSRGPTSAVDLWERTCPRKGRYS